MWAERPPQQTGYDTCWNGSKMEYEQTDLFGEMPLNILDHYDGMPEYNNVKQKDPEVVAKFKFRNKEDFDKFMEVVKRELYGDKRVFDGNQRVNDYQAWFPLTERPSEFLCIDCTDEY